MRHRGTHRRNRPPRSPLPSPGDLSWGPFDMGGTYVPSHLIRSDDLELFLRPRSFTVAHHGRDVTELDISNVLQLLALQRTQVKVTYARTPSQREFAISDGEGIAWMIQELISARAAVSPGTAFSLP